MAVPYRFTHVPAHRLIRVEVAGLWTIANVTAFRDEAMTFFNWAKSQQLEIGAGKILLSLKDFAVQPPDVLAELNTLFGTVTLFARRVAVIRSGSALQHMQSLRLATEKVSFFDDEDSARAWLFSAA